MHGAGVAVLEAIQEDGLQQHAHEVGTYLIQQLQSLQQVCKIPVHIKKLTCRHSVGGLAPGCNCKTVSASSTHGTSMLGTKMQMQLRRCLPDSAQHAGLLDVLSECILQVHQCIGHVRGLGLFVGVEMVTDQHSQLPAPGTAKWIKESLKARKVLVSTDGHHNTVIKIKPPMCFNKQNVDTLIQHVSELLQSGIPEAVQEVDRQYNPQDKGTRTQNTSWQKLPANGHAMQQQPVA